MYNSNFLKLFFLLQILCFTAKCYAEEKITAYEVYIKILSDTTLEIRERIDVISEGIKIRRGIYRDFPTKYRDKRGFNYNVGFDVTAVGRDGQKEDYHTERLNNGIRVYIGNKNRFLENGNHSYLLSFKTNRQLGFFEDHDELYFNAIGTGWEFPIEHANVTVELPENVGKENFKTDGFTGIQGSTSKTFRVTNVTDRTVSFAVVGRLESFEGFTIVLGWPKGIIKAPTFKENLIYIIKDSIIAVVAILITLFALVLNIFLWLSYGVDPKKGVIYPRFEAPKNLAPYDIPYIMNMGYVPKCLSSAIVSCAVKGHAQIREEAMILGFGTTFFIDKANKNKQTLDNVENIVLSNILEGESYVECTNVNHRQFEAAKNTLISFCDKKLSNYYKSNFGWNVPGIILTAFATMVSTEYAFPPLTIAIGIIAAAQSVLFYFLIKRYSVEGRALLDEIEGYKMYLDTAEKGHYDNIQFPQITEERFESHFPYAVAMGVEANWMSAFRKAMTINGQDPSSYRPTYYMGNRPWNESRFMNDSSSSFSSTIASSSTPPGSSSGFSGGGSSGGGGGGGGGGGW